MNQVLCLSLLASVLAYRRRTPVSNLVMALVNGVFFSLPQEYNLLAKCTMSIPECLLISLRLWVPSSTIFPGNSYISASLSLNYGPCLASRCHPSNETLLLGVFARMWSSVSYSSLLQLPMNPAPQATPAPAGTCGLHLPAPLDSSPLPLSSGRHVPRHIRQRLNSGCELAARKGVRSRRELRTPVALCEEGKTFVLSSHMRLEAHTLDIEGKPSLQALRAREFQGFRIFQNIYPEVFISHVRVLQIHSAWAFNYLWCSATLSIKSWASSSALFFFTSCVRWRILCKLPRKHSGSPLSFQLFNYFHLFIMCLQVTNATIHLSICVYSYKCYIWYIFVSYLYMILLCIPSKCLNHHTGQFILLQPPIPPGHHLWNV